MVHIVKSKLKNKKGFTLIELLAVIVILGIIAAIAIPAIGNVINKSSDKAKVAEGLQIIDAAKLYVANNNNISYTPSTDGNTATKTLTYTELSTYLDRVKDSAFTVTLTEDTTTNQISYSITGHECNTVVKKTTATEQDLVNYNK